MKSELIQTMKIALAGFIEGLIQSENGPSEDDIKYIITARGGRQGIQRHTRAHPPDGAVAGRVKSKRPLGRPPEIDHPAPMRQVKKQKEDNQDGRTQTEPVGENP